MARALAAPADGKRDVIVAADLASFGGLTSVDPTRLTQKDNEDGLPRSMITGPLS